MSTLNDFYPTDDVDDVLDDWIRDLISSSFLSKYKNVETLSATKTLADSDTPIQRLNCNGADRIAKMPTADAVNNHPYLVVNSTASGTYKLTLQNNGATVTHLVLYPNQAALCLPDGNGAYVVTLLRITQPAVSTALEGLQLIWNSATSLSVGTGLCYAENGDQFDVSSTLTASSLSLSSSTWYHVYVYLSSGTPAMEVVTTAPVAWKGTAYSKTSDTSRRYVGSIKTDGSGNVYRFLHNPHDNAIQYVDVNPSAAPFLVLNAGTASSATSISLTGAVPTTAEFSILRTFNSGDKVFYLGALTASSTQFTMVVGAASGAISPVEVQIVPSPSQTVYYRFASALGSGSASVYVYGYLFKR